MIGKRFTILLIMMFLIILPQVNYNSNDEDNSSGTHALASVSEFSTFIGGSDSESSTRITTDNEDNIILKFVTRSNDLPTSDTSFQPDYSGGRDGFIAKFSPQGELIFSTYLGGSEDDHIVRTVIDDSNNIYIVGSTYSPDFYVTDDALQSEYQGSADGYITKLSPNGTLLYSSFFGGTRVDRIQHIMFHEDGSFLIEGYTASYGLATDDAYQSSCSGASDTFVAKLNSDLNSILMFTYFGGSSNDFGWRVDIDSEYNFIICGETQSANLPTTPNAICETYSGSIDAFVTKISSNGSKLLYSTYMGGPYTDFGGGVDVDSSDGFYITGAASSGFTMLNFTQNLHHGGMDFFAAKFTKDCNLIFFKMIGGNRTDFFWDALLDADGNIILVGTTNSDDYPIINAVQQERAGRNDACVTVLSSDGNTISLSTFIGGSSAEKGEGIAVLSDGSLIISGYSSSDDFPVGSNPYQQNRTGAADAFLYHINPAGNSQTTLNTSLASSDPPQTSWDNLSVVTIIASVGLVVIVLSSWIILKKR